MPSIAAHMICAKLVAHELKIIYPDFMKGNLLPNIINIKNSHRKIKGKYYYIPDINYFINILDFCDNLHLGYLVHLLLDTYFLEDYIYDVVCGQDVFLSGVISREYDIINYRLLEMFRVNINYLNSILKDFRVSIDEEKYHANIRSLNHNDMSSHPNYFDVENFSEFLIETSKLIVKYLKEVKQDEYKLSLSNFCTRK